MATQELLQVYGTQLVFADVTDFPNSGIGPPTTAANSLIIGTPTAVQIDLTNVAAAAARQSTKTATLAKTGSAWPISWVFGACMENATAPAAGGTYDFYWAPSPSATAGTGNPGAVTGADGAFTVGTENQLIRIGSLVVANTVINISTSIGTLWVPYLYGSLVVINNTSTGLHATTMDETHIVATPIIPDAQAAA